MSVVYASQTLTVTGQPSNTNTVVIGGKTYTYQTTLTDSDGNVKIGADAEESLENLKAAINLEAGAGTLYADSMTAHDHVVCSAQNATTLTVKSLVPGKIGNLIATTETHALGSWGAAVLASGDGSIKADIEDLIAAHQMPAALEQALRDLTDPLSAE
jgi:hypothetical protein